MTNNKCWCGLHKIHNGNKKLAAAHSKIAQAKFTAERARLEELNGTPVETKTLFLPFKSMFNKTQARILL